MTIDQIQERQQALYKRVLGATDWAAMRDYASARIELHRVTMETCDPSEVPRLQGQIAEARYLENLEATLRTKIQLSQKSNPPA